jgi:phage tail-like protein
MDANGQNFCLISEAAQWQLLEEPSGLEFDTSRRALRLARQRREVSFGDNRELAEEKLDQVPHARDAFGNRARVDAQGNGIVATGLYPGETRIFEAASEDAVISDLVMGYDDVLYIAVDGRVVMHDRRERWTQQNVELPPADDFNAWRMAADPRGGVWVLERGSGKLARVLGMPLHKLAKRDASTRHPRHCVRNTDPPRMELLPQPAWTPAETPVAIACNGRGVLALLTWVEGDNCAIRLIDNDHMLHPGMTLLGSMHPYSLAWLDDGHVAVLLAGVNNEAPVYALGVEQAAIWPVGDLYPLKKDFAGGPFLHGLDAPPHYSTPTASRALQRLSFPFYSRQGQAASHPQAAPLDGGQAGHIWHRLFLEAVIPEGCGIKVWLAASDKKQSYAEILSRQWHEHRFGSIHRQTTRADTPVAAWENFASEIPHHGGLLPCAIERDKAGLFSVLIQRASRRLRPLRGRYLQVQVELTGQGRETPEIFALRAYGARFSYIDEYLPMLYRETVFPSDEEEADEAATAADFYGRFVANFEGVLTTIEDRIAQAHLLTDPRTTPVSALPWLASWIGYEINSSFSEETQRCMLRSAPELYRWHGSLRGLKLALEIATGGALSSGEIVIVEDFRLRRTFASIIGADLVVEDDPLTAGGSVNSNSFVGDTLFVGDENRAEFLALFDAELLLDASEQQAIDDFFDRLAHRITVLVHEEVAPQDLGLIKAITEQETPAHVQSKVLSASSRFLVGMSSLVGVDSYLAGRVQPRSARVGASRLGRNDYVQGPAALDNRLQGSSAGTPGLDPLKPLALAPDVSAEFGDDITLDASASRAFGGRSLAEFNWDYKGTGE